MRTEPVAITVLVPIILWLGSRYGLKLDESTATIIAGAALGLLGTLTRQRLVTPVADPHNNKGQPLVPAR